MPKVAKPKPVRKPRPDFPLTPHPAGYWCKKVGGKIEYFGRVAVCKGVGPRSEAVSYSK